MYDRLDDICDDEEEEEDSGFGQYNTSEILPKVIVSPNMNKNNNVNQNHNFQQNAHQASGYNSNSNNTSATTTRPLLNQHYGEKRKNRILSLQQINFDPAIAQATNLSLHQTTQDQ